MPGFAGAAAADDPIPAVNSSDEATSAARTWWFAWPLLHVRKAPDESVVAMPPLFSTRLEHESGERRTDVLWPIVRYRSVPRHWNDTRYKFFVITPIWHQRSGVEDGAAYRHRVLFPLYWQGSKDGQGGYFVLFPFVWQARNADVKIPFFPNKPQTFTALWPVAGEFRDWYNRDVIQWFLWPLFMHSWKGDGEERFDTYTLGWPFFALHTGPRVSGFRAWPLASWAKKRGEFERAYWLWPLGHYRYDRQKESKTTLFIPFYGRTRSDTVAYDWLFPFYGRMDMKGRRLRGYMLAAYHTDDNLRRGVRVHRLLWFLITWRTRIPIPPDLERDDIREPSYGWGVFPFYIRRSSPTQLREKIMWPFWYRRIDRYEQFDYDRYYFFPFYFRRVKTFTDGTKDLGEFCFPFYRRWKTPEGEEYRNVLHLRWHTRAEPVDRNWSPLWTVWESYRNPETGESRKRLLWFLWQKQKFDTGLETKRFNGLMYSESFREGGTETSEAHRRILGGLVGLHRVGDKRQVELFWIKL